MFCLFLKFWLDKEAVDINWNDGNLVVKKFGQGRHRDDVFLLPLGNDSSLFEEQDKSLAPLISGQ